MAGCGFSITFEGAEMSSLNALFNFQYQMHQSMFDKYTGGVNKHAIINKG